MARIIWTPEALRNLDLINEYVTRVASAEVATRLLDRLTDSVEPVAQFPKLGRVVPEFEHDDVRELIREDYRIVYRVAGDTVRVVSVSHGSMDIGAILRQRLGGGT